MGTESPTLFVYSVSMDYDYEGIALFGIGASMEDAKKLVPDHQREGDWEGDDERSEVLATGRGVAHTSWIIERWPVHGAQA
jgi:hypothetical protein